MNEELLKKAIDIHTSGFRMHDCCDNLSYEEVVKKMFALFADEVISAVKNKKVTTCDGAGYVSESCETKNRVLDTSIKAIESVV